MSQKIQVLASSQKFLELLETNKDKLVVADFYAEWCGPCKVLGETLHNIVEVNGKYPDTVFVKLNVDEEGCDEVVNTFGVTSIPRVLVLHDKRIVKDIVGNNAKDLFTFIDNFKG